MADTPNQYEGQVTLPNDGAVTSVTTHDPEETQAASNANAPSVPGTQPQAQGQQPSSDQPQNPQGQNPQQADLSKTPAQPGSPSAPPQTDAQKKSVGFASHLRTIAQTLAGGPRFTESIDVNTGQMLRKEVPMSRADIGMALAMEAISGALGGLTQTGPNHEAKAAAAGFQMGEQQRQQVQQQQDANAQADFSRHFQILSTNMQMHQNALQLGRSSMDMQQAIINQWKPLADKLREDYPMATKDIVNESDLLSKYNVTTDQAIPVGLSAKIDPQTGHQALGKDGEPLFETQYMAVDPNFMAGDFLNDKDMEALVEMGTPGITNGDRKAINWPKNFQARLSQAIGLKAQATAYELAKQEIGTYYDKINQNQAPDLDRLDMPTLRNEAVQSLVDQAADKYGVPPALARAVVQAESGGNQDRVSKRGAVGVMQLMPDTAKMLGVDPNNEAQNIDGGVHYLHALLYGDDALKIKGYNGNLRLAAAAYNAGPNAVTDHVPTNGETEGYVAKIAKMIGLDKAVDGGQKVTPVNLGEAVAKDQSLPSALQKFQRYANATAAADGVVNYRKALGELAAVDAPAAGKVAQLFGGYDMIGRYEQSQQVAADVAKKTADKQVQNAAQAADRQAKKDENGAIYAEDAKTVAGDPNDPGSEGMVDSKMLISQRTADRPMFADMVKMINPHWEWNIADEKAKLWEDFTTDRGKTSANITSFNQFFGHSGDLFDADEEYRRSNMGELLNKPLSWWHKNAVTNPAYQREITAMSAVRQEYVTFLENNHALTKEDKELGNSLLNENMSPAALETAVKTMMQTAAVRMVEINNKWKRVFNRNFPGMVSDDALSMIQRFGPDSQIMKLLGGLDTGGLLTGSPDGRGTPGRPVGAVSIGKGSDGKKYYLDASHKPLAPVTGTGTGE